MAVALTTIFGSEIRVAYQPIEVDRQFSGFPGGHGLVGMHLGSRGHRLTIQGTIAVSGADYPTARAGLRAALDVIETYLSADPADYSFGNEVFYAVVFGPLQLIADSKGKTIHWLKGNYAGCEFICHARCML